MQDRVLEKREQHRKSIPEIYIGILLIRLLDTKLCICRVKLHKTGKNYQKTVS